MKKWLLGIACCFCCSVAIAQEGSDLLDDFTSLDSSTVTSNDQTASELNVDALANAKADDVEILNVRLQNNGKLSGRLQVYYPTGKSEPATATVAFTQSGQLVSSVTTDDMGHFHVEGLEPGDYTATASMGEASTDFQVKVLAFDEHAAPEEMFLEGTLTPIPAGDMVVDGGCVDCGCDTCGGEIISEEFVDSGIIVDEAPMIVDEGFVIDEGMPIADCGCGATPPTITTGYTPSCGTCGGGGGGGGFGGRGLRLLGIGGLAAGITALAIDDDDPVSPAAP